MFVTKFKQANARAKTANKVALETEKEKYAAEKAVEELKRQLQPKRARSDDDAGDAHDLIAEFDNWDLRDHHREGTRVQNRRNVQVGSRDNQQKPPRTGKEGFLHHTRLGLVGWISYWCCGDAPLTVVMLVVLINTGVWACIQTREVWSTEEETNMWPGHFWICKLGTVPGSMTCVEKKFEL
jgi:hypothetical protein